MLAFLSFHKGFFSKPTLSYLVLLKRSGRLWPPFRICTYNLSEIPFNEEGKGDKSGPETKNKGLLHQMGNSVDVKITS